MYCSRARWWFRGPRIRRACARATTKHVSTGQTKGRDLKNVRWRRKRCKRQEHPDLENARCRVRVHDDRVIARRLQRSGSGPASRRRRALGVASFSSPTTTTPRWVTWTCCNMPCRCVGPAPASLQLARLPRPVSRSGRGRRWWCLAAYLLRAVAVPQVAPTPDGAG